MLGICGYHAIEELLRSGKAQGRLEYSDRGPRVKKILEEAERWKIPAAKVEKADLEKRFPDARGVVFLPEGDVFALGQGIDDFIAGLGDKTEALVLVLDHISDPHNFGAILRSADQFGVDLVVLPNARSVKDTETVLRSSSGAAAHVAQAVVPNLARALQDLKDAGFWVYAADMGGDILWDVDFTGRVCLVMGAEGAGIGRLLSESADRRLSIPSLGQVDSLNVSVAAGVFLYEMARQRMRGPQKA